MQLHPRTFVPVCSKYCIKDIRVLIRGKREGEESLLARVVSRCAASVSLSTVGVSSDDQSGRGWVEKDIRREGRGRETERGEKRFNLCLDNAALSRQIIIHEPIYIIPCTGALSYHSHALKYQSFPASTSHPPPFPRCIERGAYVYAIDKRNCGSPDRSNAPARDARVSQSYL